MRRDRERIAAALPAYEIGVELGRGGWAVVLSAHHRDLGREVAVKQLPPAFAADPVARQRFLREAQLLAGFDHQHIVRIYDYVASEGLCLVVMEKLSGGSLWERFTAGITMPEACAVTLAAASGLQGAHACGVLHRDVKPHNLLFSESGTLKLTDFGLAKSTAVQAGATALTRAGEVIGTPAYMAPEQVIGERVGPATDVYSTGVVLFELLAGRLPFASARNAVELALRRVEHPPAELCELAPEVPEPVAEVVMRTLTRRPQDRIASAEQLSAELLDAATRAWGTTWLAMTGVPVFGLAQHTPAPATTSVADGREMDTFALGGSMARTGDFKLEEPLGAGSWKRTFRARTSEGESIAVTVLSEQLSRETRFQEAFEREAALAKPLHHRHLEQVLEAGDLDGRCFLARGFVEGRSLEELLATTGAQPLDLCLRLASSLAGALQHVHDAGLLHGHLDPSAVIIGAGREVTLVGCGLAAATALEILGTSAATAFSAPEATTSPTTASDVYSLGALLVACLLGRPGEADELADLAPASATGVLTRALAGSASERPSTPRALARLFVVAARQPRD
jgi:serine/threonine-protein kinase